MAQGLRVVNTPVVFIAAVILCLVLSLRAQAAPEIQVDNEAISGLLTGGKDTEFVFNIRNSGDEDLIITDVLKSCGCTDAATELMTVPPKGQTRLVGTYHPDPTRATFAIQIMVRSNAVNAPLQYLAVAGRNFPDDVEISPQAIQFVSVQGEPAAAESLIVKTQKTVTLEQFAFDYKSVNGGSSAQLDVFSLKQISSSDHQLSLEIEPHTPQSLGSYTATLKLDLLVGEKPRRYELPVVLEVVSEFLIAPPQVTVPPVEHTKTLDVRGLIKDRKGEPFKVLAIESPTEAIRTRLKENTAASYFVFFSITNKEELGGKTFQTRIKIEQKGNIKVVEMPVVFAAEEK